MDFTDFLIKKRAKEIDMYQLTFKMVRSLKAGLRIGEVIRDFYIPNIVAESIHLNEFEVLK